MKIDTTSLSLPSKKVSNDEVIDLIKFHSNSTFTGDLGRSLRKINIILKKSGARNRYWLDCNKNEKPIDHIVKVADEALKKANLSKSDIDILIFVGIGKGFLEPAQSYIVAKALGMDKVRCFDVTDACMSWISGLQIIDSFFHMGHAKKAMIINAEFVVQGGSLINNYTLNNDAEIEYSFPAFTVGEAATCTILSNDNSKNFKFNFSSKTSLSDSCVIPLPQYQKFCKSSEIMALNGPIKFTSFGKILHDAALIEVVDLYKKSKIINDKVDIVYTHASSREMWHEYAKIVGIEKKVYHIYQETGNLVSASIPAAIAMSCSDNSLKRGNNVVFWVGSAGMSFNVTNFNY